ncbi:MAG: hypothetical protein LBG99_00315 [Propionibacteriaceae bacterium]|nr:hypothetical protein [Propionibacteriaceae bacterium]
MSPASLWTKADCHRWYDAAARACTATYKPGSAQRALCYAKAVDDLAWCIAKAAVVSVATGGRVVGGGGVGGGAW